jgi:peptidyl-prolyl cis-trans isomerase A (cyclophilin A)
VLPESLNHIRSRLSFGGAQTIREIAARQPCNCLGIIHASEFKELAIITHYQALLSWFALTLLSATHAHADSLPQVKLDTSLGEIVIEVDPKHAPISAGEFLRYVDAGLYDGGAFYRVVRSDNDPSATRIDVIQGGLTALDRALPPVRHETTERTGIHHTNGVISLARRELGTGTGAKFFICIGNQPALDFGGRRNPDGQGFAAFGRVVKGMDIVRKIHALPVDPQSGTGPTQGQMLAIPVVIRAAARVDKRLNPQ